MPNENWRRVFPVLICIFCGEQAWAVLTLANQEAGNVGIMSQKKTWSWWAQASCFPLVHSAGGMLEDEYFSFGTALCLHRYFVATFWMKVSKYFVYLPGETFISQEVTKLFLLRCRNPLQSHQLCQENYLQFKNFGVPQGSSDPVAPPGLLSSFCFSWFLCCTCHLFLPLQKKTMHFSTPWKPAL